MLSPLCNAEVPRCRRYVCCGSWLRGLEEFDESLFGVAPGDAMGMDPQARVLLEQIQVRIQAPSTCLDWSKPSSARARQRTLDQTQ